MGARAKGDIKTLCKLTDINYGIISNVGPQHIETFKSIENIYSTKKELSDYLLNNLCVYNSNNFYTKKMYLEKKGEKSLIAIFDFKSVIKNNIKDIKFYNNKENNNLKEEKNKTNKKIKSQIFYSKSFTKPDIYAKNVKIINGFTNFDCIISGKIYKFKTQLLGNHNISNILLCISLAIKLGIDIFTLQEKTENLSPTSHRLQLVKGRINILDDSYNCSLASAKTAVEVLSQFSGKKMICTPGIIEGGKLQTDLNLSLCKLIDNPDYILVFVGLTNRKIFKSYFSDKKNVYYVDTLERAKELFYLLNENDTLLLLNDLPDDYK